MAVFSSNEADRPREHGRGAPRDGNLSIIAAGMKVVGEMSCDGVVKVEGNVEGTVRAARQVLIAKEGLVEGDVYTREAIVGGQVVGSIYADERVEIQTGSLVRGDIVTQRLIVQEGGEVNGGVQMGNPKTFEQTGHTSQAQDEETPATRDPHRAQQQV